MAALIRRGGQHTVVVATESSVSDRVRDARSIIADAQRACLRFTRIGGSLNVVSASLTAIGGDIKRRLQTMAQGL